MSGINTRSEALRRLQASLRKAPLDDDGGNLDEDATEVFSSLPKPPSGWDNPEAELDFKMSPKEQDCLRRKLGLLTRPGDKAPALLAKLVEGRGYYPSAETTLPRELDSHADADDKPALRIARDAAELSAIGRAVYGALVEHLRTEDGKKDDGIFPSALRSHFDKYEAGASRCDLETLKVLLPTIPPYVNDVLAQTQAYVRDGKPEAFLKLRARYQYSEVMRKTGRARLANTLKAVQRRNEWEPRSTQHHPAALPVVCRKKDLERPEWPIMSKDSWPKFSFTELLKPPDGWKTDHAVLCTYSADLVVIIKSLLALSGCDLESRRTGTRVELVRAIEALRGRVRILGQSGRLVRRSGQMQILKLLDRFIKTVKMNENENSFHPKAALMRYQNADERDDFQWRIWFGSRNLTRAMNWEAGAVLVSRRDGKGQKVDGLAAAAEGFIARARLSGLSAKAAKTELEKLTWECPRDAP